MEKIVIELSKVDFLILEMISKKYKQPISLLVHEAISSLYYTEKNLKFAQEKMSVDKIGDKK
jgi:ribosomal protein L33